MNLISNRIAIVIVLAAAVIWGMSFAAGHVAWWGHWHNFMAGFVLTVVSGGVLLSSRERQERRAE